MNVNEIYYPNNVFKYIIHISDIHIRLNSKHDEYIEVFNNLYKELDENIEKGIYNNDNTLLVCTGDLLHDKITLTSESIILCIEFLQNLVSRFKTILIAGNHDGYLNRSEKIDLITGILHGKTFKDLFYIKNSQIVHFGNILFGVSSVFDNTIINSSNLDNYISTLSLNNNNNPIKIALYHGMVGKIELQNLYSSKGQYDINDFIGYDLVLLGDVHKYQYLDENKTIGYASSLISQNYGECDEYHGYLLWDLENKQSNYHIITNEYRSKKGTLINDLLMIDKHVFDIKTDMDNIIKYLPKKGRVQVSMEKENYDNYKQLKNKIKTIYWTEKCDLVIKKDETKTNIKKINKNIYINRKDIVRNILKNKHKKDIDENIIDWIETELNNNDVKIQMDNNLDTAEKFELLNLKFDNLFIYGDNNEIDFTNYGSNDVILLCGKNSWGKSSIIDIIVFNLYNDYAREVSSQVKKGTSGILNNLKSSGMSELLFKIGFEYYIVRREYHRNKKGLIDTESFIYKLILQDNYEEIKPVTDISITVSTKKGTNKRNKLDSKKVTDNIYIFNNITYIKELITVDAGVNREIFNLIGSKDNFVLINLMLQHDNISFKNKTQSERKIILYKLLNLDKYDKIKLLVDDERKTVSKSYELMLKDMNKINIIGLKENYDNNVRTLDIVLNDKNNIDNKLAIIQDKIIMLNKEYNSSNDTDIILNDLNIVNSIINTNMNITDVDTDKIIFHINILNNKINELNKNNDELKNDLQLIQNDFNNMNNANDNNIYDRNNYTIISTKYNEQDINNYMIKTKELKSKCDDYINSYNEISKKILELGIDNEIININNNIQELNIIKKNLINENKDISNLTKLVEQNYELNDNINIATKKQITLQNNIDDIEQKIKDIDIEYIKIKMNEYKEVNEKINMYDTEMTFKQKLYNDLNVFEFNPNCDACMKNPKRIEIMSLKMECDELKSKIILLMKNDILYKIDDYTEQFNMYNKYNNNLNIMYKDNSILLKKISEMEVTRSNINKYILYKNKLDETEQSIIKYNIRLELLKNDPLLIKRKDCEINITQIKELLLKDEYNQEYLDNEMNNIMKNKFNKIMLDYIDRIINIKKTIENNEFEIKNITNNIDIMTRTKDMIIKNRNIIDNNKQIEKELDRLNLQNNVMKNKNDELITYINKLKNDIDKEQQYIIKYEEDTIELKRLEKENIKYEYYKDILDKDGISLYIVRQYLRNITDGINEIIERLINKKVDIYEENDKIMIDIISNDNKIITLGGMETFIMDIAFKIILSRISNISQSNILIIDEGISAFDKEHISDIEELFGFITTFYDKVLLMSHLEEIKDKVDNKIYITKNGIDSNVIG